MDELVYNINEIIKKGASLTIGFKGGYYYAMSESTQGKATSIETAIERLLIILTQEGPKDNTWGA